jgi:serine acetyltransferase
LSDDQGNHSSPDGRATGREDVAIELTAPSMRFHELVWSDYRAATLERDESPRAAIIKFLPRLLFNPSLQFALLVRVAQKGPRLLSLPIRWLQVVVFSSEIYWFSGLDAIEIGPGIKFPHPFGIIIGPAVRIGTGVTIYNNTNIGESRHIPSGGSARAAPHLGDRSVIYAYTAVQGKYVIGHDAVVGIHVVLDGDVPAGALRTYRGLKLAGEWPGEGRRHFRLQAPASRT